MWNAISSVIRSYFWFSQPLSALGETLCILYIHTFKETPLKSGWCFLFSHSITDQLIPDASITVKLLVCGLNWRQPCCIQQLVYIMPLATNRSPNHRLITLSIANAKSHDLSKPMRCELWTSLLYWWPHLVTTPSTQYSHLVKWAWATRWANTVGSFAANMSLTRGTQ